MINMVLCLKDQMSRLRKLTKAAPASEFDSFLTNGNHSAGGKSFFSYVVALNYVLRGKVFLSFHGMSRKCPLSVKNDYICYFMFYDCRIIRFIPNTE